MYLAFIDGSGNTGLNLTHPTSTMYLLMGLAVHGHAARAMEDEASVVLTPWFGAATREPGFECKGSDLYQGEGPCASMSPAERVAPFTELMALVGKHDARLIWQAIDKPRLAARYPSRRTLTGSPSPS